MKTTDSTLSDTGLVIKQEDGYIKTTIEVRVVKNNNSATLQIIIDRWTNKRSKPLVCLDLDKESTVQLFHLIGNILSLQR